MTSSKTTRRGSAIIIFSAKETKYKKAVEYMNENQYTAATEELSSIKGYKDANDLYEISENMKKGAFGNVIKKKNVTSFIVPSVIDGKTVTSIGDYAFHWCIGLTSITIPDSVTSIGYAAFFGCSGLTSITYKGTKAQWQAINKGFYWEYLVPSSCLVHCTDETVSIYD